MTGRAQAGFAGHEDAERVPGRIGVDPQRFLGVAGAVVEQPGAQGQRPLVLGVEIGGRGDRQIQVQLLRHRAVGHVNSVQLRHLLEGDPGGAGGVPQHQPVLAARVRLTGAGGSSPGR